MTVNTKDYARYAALTKNPAATELDLVDAAARAIRALHRGQPRRTGYRFWGGGVVRGEAVLISPWGTPTNDPTQVLRAAAQLPVLCHRGQHVPPAPECECGHYLVNDLKDLVARPAFGEESDFADAPLVVGKVVSLGRTAPAPTYTDLPSTFRATSYLVVGPLHLSPGLSTSSSAAAFRSAFECTVTQARGGFHDWLRLLPRKNREAAA